MSDSVAKLYDAIEKAKPMLPKRGGLVRRGESLKQWADRRDREDRFKPASEKPKTPQQRWAALARFDVRNKK